MNISCNLFSLMFKLSQLDDGERVAALFVETLNLEFKPARFYFIEKSENETGVEIEISTRNSLFGFIRIEQSNPFINEHFSLISNACKMLAILLEHIEMGKKLQSKNAESEYIAGNQSPEIRYAPVIEVNTDIESANKVKNLTDELLKQTQFEAELLEQAERCKLLVENSLDAVMLTSPDGSVFSANSAACEMFQMTEAEICELGRNGLVDLTDTNLPRLLEERNRKGKARGKLRLVRKDGSVFPAEVSSAVYTNQKGEIRNSLIIRDISEWIKTEEKLEHSYDLMKYVIEHSNGAVAIHDNELRYIFVSERFLIDYKVKDQDIIGKYHYDVFPDLPQKWRDVHQRVLKGEVCFSDCDSFPRSDGTMEWTKWECRPWFNVDGDVGGIIIYSEIITKHVVAENAMRESEIRFRMLAETVPFGIVITDLNQKVMFVNQQFTHIFGYTISDIPTVEEWWPLAYPDKAFRDEIRKNWEEKIKNTKPGSDESQYAEYPVKCSDGSVKMIEFRLAMSGQFYFNIFIDITERKIAEYELIQLKNDLEFQVAEKTRELQLRINELERFQDATIEREFRIKELRDEIKQLKSLKP